MATLSQRIVVAAGLVLLGSVVTAAAFLIDARRQSALNGIDCQILDPAQVSSESDRNLWRLLNPEWGSHARVCSMGGFSIAVPASQTEGHVINVSKGQRPVFRRTQDDTWVYSPTVPVGRFDQMVVNIWHPCEGDVTRLFYDTRGKESSVSVGDLNFDGLPDSRFMWANGEIVQGYGWYQGAWHQLEKRKMLIEGQWRPVRFEDGEYRIENSGDAPPPTDGAGQCHGLQ
jgi:hypothetical protein